MTATIQIKSDAKRDPGLTPPPRKVQFEGISYWRVLTLVALALMNASWGAAFFRTFVPGGTQNSLLPIMAYFTILPLVITSSIFIIRWLRFNPSVERLVGLAMLGLAILIAFPTLLYPVENPGLRTALLRYFSAFTNLEFALRPEPITTVLILIFWRRGLSLARHWVGPIVVQRDFRIGLIILLVLGFVASGLRRELPYSESFLLLFSALMAMGSARLSVLSHIRGGRTIPFDRRWFLAVSLGASGLIAITGGLAFIGGEPLADGFGRLFALIGSALGAALLFVLRPVIVLLTELFNRLLAGLLPLISENEPDLQALPSPEQVSQMMEGLSEEIAPPPFAGGLLDTVQIVLITLGALIFILVVYYSLRRTRVGRMWRNLEERERETIVGSIPDYLWSLLRGVRRGTNLINRLNPAAQVLAAARIRQIYRRLLRMSARLGLERDDADTPLEFLVQLPQVFPDSQLELERITRAYLRVRYGEYPETRQEVDQVETAWQQVRRTGRPWSEQSRSS